MTGTPDWESLIWEARGYLGLDEDEPVPRDELVEQAKANGWGERESQEAIRNADILEHVGDLDDPRVQLTDSSDADEKHHLARDKPDADSENGGDRSQTAENTPDASAEWDGADFTATESGVWPPELLEREQWMDHVEKKPFAPWADCDHPEADPDEDARWKWGLEANYVDGETVAMAEDDPRLDGRAFLQQPDDPYVYVDGDDVSDPETGAVHPAFIAILEHFGLTYADVSQSDTGAHAMYRGSLPDGVKQAAWQLDDEPWGSNDDLPSIEVYPGKRVCVATGEHVPGTPTEIRDWNDDVLEALLEANDEVATQQREDPSTARDDYDLDDYEPTATSTDETTDDIRDIFAALDRLDARAVAEKTIVHAWNDQASTSEGYRAFYPTWGTNSNGTANVVNEQIWQDTGDRGGYGGPVVMALIDAGEMQPSNASPQRATGELWWTGIHHLRDLGFAIPTSVHQRRTVEATLVPRARSHWASWSTSPARTGGGQRRSAASTGRRLRRRATSCSRRSRKSCVTRTSPSSTLRRHSGSPTPSRPPPGTDRRSRRRRRPNGDSDASGRRRTRVGTRPRGDPARRRRGRTPPRARADPAGQLGEPALSSCPLRAGAQRWRRGVSGGELHRRYDEAAERAYDGIAQQPITRRSRRTKLQNYDLIQCDGSGAGRQYRVIDESVTSDVLKTTNRAF